MQASTGMRMAEIALQCLSSRSLILAWIARPWLDQRELSVSTTCTLRLCLFNKYDNEIGAISLK